MGGDFATLPGWCPTEKAAELIRLVREHRPAVICEVGVFGGRSLLPMAAACREIGRGVCYAVDPWTRDAAIEGTVRECDREWWSQVDLAAVKATFFGAILEHDLAAAVRVLEGRWADVHPAVPEIDIGHIDGNHSPEVSGTDASLMLAKLRPGGIVVMDDTDSPDQIAPALRQLDERCHLIRDWGKWRVYQKRW